MIDNPGKTYLLYFYYTLFYMYVFVYLLFYRCSPQASFIQQKCCHFKLITYNDEIKFGKEQLDLVKKT